MRGKERLAMPLRVAQKGRLILVWGAVLSIGMLLLIEAMSVGGQVRFVPPCIERVGWPHEAQKGLRLFQSISARA